MKTRVRKEGTRVTVSGYIVKTINKTGKVVTCSDLFSDIKKVKTYISDMNELWNKSADTITPADYTKDQKFTNSGIALPAI